MGISSDGILVFGVDLGCEEEWFPTVLPDAIIKELTGDGFDNYIYRCAGVPEFRDDETEDEQDARWEAQRAAINACPVKDVLHCSYDYGMWILAVRGTEMIAPRGCPQEITSDKLQVPPEKVEAFKAWCTEHGIELHTEPGWILTSVYG